jgi:hypothetical protein
MSDQNQSSSLLNKPFWLYSLLITIVLLHISFQNSTAQIAFEKVRPTLFDTVDVSPSHFAIGDINNDDFDDLVLAANGYNPVVYFYNPDSSGWDLSNHQILTELNVSNIGHINIIDQDLDDQNEIIFGFNRFDRGAWAFKYDAEQDSIIRTGLQGVYAANSFRGVSYYNFFDYNKDGLLDGLQSIDATKTGLNFFYSNFFNQNNQNNVRLGGDITDTYGSTQSSFAFDFDKNGFVDVFEIHSQVNGSNFSFQQDHFYSGSETGLRETFGHPLSGFTASMSAAVGDYNNDGLLDVYQTIGGSTARNLLFKNEGNNQFSSVQNVTTQDVLHSRSATWGDIDNDGDLDLLVVEYTGSSGIGAYPSLYRNDGPDEQGKTQFSKVNQNSVPILSSLGFWLNGTMVDYNYDGSLDVLMMGNTSVEPVVVFKNTDESYNWLGFTLEQTNAFYPEPFNAKITIRARLDQGGPVVSQYREISPFHGHGSQQTFRINVGLKNATSANITIEWSSGLIEQKSFNSNQINRYHHIKESPGGKMVLLNEQPYPVISQLEEKTIDTLYIANIGEADVTISSITENKPYLQITGFSERIVRRDTGYVALEYFPDRTLYLGSHTDTLFIQSSALDGLNNIILTSDIRTQPAQFERKVLNITEPFLTTENAYSKPLFTDINYGSDHELFFQRKDSSSHLFYTAKDRSSTEQISFLGSFSNSIRNLAIGDLNNDGWLDVFASAFGRDDIALITQPFTSSYVTEELPFSDLISNSKSTHAVITDYNQDGFNDVLIARSSSQKNLILEGSADGTIQPKTNHPDDDFINRSNSAVFLNNSDLNNDGLTDLIVVQRNSQNGDLIDVYFQNENNDFELGTVAGITNRTFSAQGVLTFDYDNDGLEDLLLVSYTADNPSELWKNNGDGTFTQMHTELFTQIAGTPSDVLVFDFNADGFKDLFFTEETFSENNKLLQSTGGEGFLIINSGDLVTNKQVSSLGATAFDYDGDGFQDILIGNYLDQSTLFMNEGNQQANWITLRAVQPESDVQILSPGSLIEVEAVINGESVRQSYRMGKTSLFGKNLAELTIGLNKATSADIKVTDQFGNTTELLNADVNRVHSLGSTFVSNEESDIPNRPTEFSISEAYPNPFNPATNLKLQLPSSGHLSVEIYNSIGQKLKTVVDNQRSAGTHTISINGQDLVTGVYFVAIRFGNQVKMRKITLLK